MQTTFFLGLGTNQGDRFSHLHEAISRLSEAFELTAVSSIYETEPWGFTEQPKFLNLVVSAKTEENARTVLETILGIETEMGRVRKTHWGPRVIDIDLLFFGEDIIDQEDLKVPHPFLFQRRFVLEPLLEIAPEKQWRGIPLRTFLEQLTTTKDVLKNG